MFVREINSDLYTRKALVDSRNAYRSYCDVQVAPLPNNRAKVSLTVKSQYAQHARQITLEFWNYFLDSSCKEHLEEA